MSIWATMTELGVDDDVGFYGSVRADNGPANRHPDHTNPPTHVLACAAPAWCVPGHEDAHDSEAVSEWLRLTADGTSVYMHHDAVAELRDTLTGWLGRDHLTPTDPLTDPCEEWER